MTPKLRVLIKADEDIDDRLAESLHGWGFDYYETSADLIAQKVEEAGETPLLFPIYPPDERVRRALIHNRPFFIIFTIDDEFITIVAVPHERQAPKTWQHRIR